MRRLFVGKRDEHRFFFKVEKYRGFGERKILKKKQGDKRGNILRGLEIENQGEEKQSKNRGREDQRTRNRRKKTNKAEGKHGERKKNHRPNSSPVRNCEPQPFFLFATTSSIVSNRQVSLQFSSSSYSSSTLRPSPLFCMNNGE